MMSFGVRTRVGPRNPVLDGGAHWRNVANTIKPSVCGSYATLCQITFTTCYYHYVASRYYIDAAYCYREYTVAWSVCLSWSCAVQKQLKRLRCRLGYGLGLGPDPHAKGQFWCKGAILREKLRPIVVDGDSVVTCAKTSEPIEMPFGMQTRVGPRNRVLDGVHIGAT